METTNATATAAEKRRFSQVWLAKYFLREHYPQAFTPDKVCEQAKLTITPATLGRKFRQAATGENSELIRTYYRNQRQEEIAVYKARGDNV